MATAHRPILLFLLLLLLLSPGPELASGLGLGQLGTLLSLSHSLMTRVANARAARGDLPGAARAHAIAANLRFLGGGWTSIWSAGWDFARNYAWRYGGGFSDAGFSRSATELLAAIYEFSQLDSATDRGQWVLRHYPALLTSSKSLIASLLQALNRSGPLREAVLVLQREVVDGELLKDCLERVVRSWKPVEIQCAGFLLEKNFVYSY
ncbi:hypothetical protein J5N97_019410 [Dioscorea zingiberensis]|uniref:Uncharacterized protein n=1 Tax=Dioscorea zingiberensis TaxID=325984 RepID=A0A9D5CDT0_9LILI|nr:hypothetical protein J5N97_019410 [Dioscorea zingiberensis]